MAQARTGGDYNSDAVVDAGDYVIWNKNNGSGNPLPNDNGLGTPIGPAHYTLWRNNFGLTLPQAWTNGNNAIFSAGTDAAGSLYAINIAAGTTASNVDIQEGTVQVLCGQMNVGSGSLTVRSGAAL